MHLRYQGVSVCVIWRLELKGNLKSFLNMFDFIFGALAINSFRKNNTLLTMLFADIWEHDDIT